MSRLVIEFDVNLDLTDFQDTQDELIALLRKSKFGWAIREVKLE